MLLFNLTQAQNLVLNSGLEDYNTCPGFGQFDSIFVQHWTKPTWGSTDYYHDSCVGIQPVSQAPHGGHAYFGVIAYNYGTEYREYATAKLSQPLTAGAAYEVEFYVSLNDGYIQAVNELGAYFSSSAPGPYSNFLHIPVTPQVENTAGVLGSTTAWMFVSGSFIASGSEQYITIGNFRDDSSTTITQVGNVGSYGAYYFIDDVLVTPTKATEIPKIVQEEFTVGPNPSSGIFQIKLSNEINEACLSWEVMDCSARIISSGKIESDPLNKTIDLTGNANGVYFLRLISNGQSSVKMLLKD